MLHSSAEMAALHAETGAGADLETAVALLEQRLAALSASLRLRDIPAIEDDANQLHRALARAVEAFTHQARHGGVPAPMRLRLARASAQVAQQREVLARATAALDRAIDVLMPPPLSGGGTMYSASGRMDSLSSCTGSLSA